MNSNIELCEDIIVQYVTAQAYVAEQICVIEFMSFIYILATYLQKQEYLWFSFPPPRSMVTC